VDCDAYARVAALTQVETVEAVVVAMVKQLLQTLRIAVLNDIRAIERRLAVLNSNVGYLVVGTHSRQIEGRIMDTLLCANGSWSPLLW
jgi:hypothetical protein